MPITKSAKKALRQSESRKEKNRKWKAGLKKTLKLPGKFSDGDKPAWLSRAYRAIDKSAKRGTIPKNKAARMKSSLAKLLRTPL